MVNVWESTLEWTKGEVIVTTPAWGPIHHVFLWIRAQEVDPLLVMDRVGRYSLRRGEGGVV